jgi:pimeloyl-ACP methyl ester carboxylesterase
MDNIHYAETSLLKIAYEERRLISGEPIVLLYGWLDDVRTWDKVVTQPNEAGFHILTPNLRGFGPTRFLFEEIMHSVQL